MSRVIVIVAYRPKPGKEGELLDLVRSRVPTLRKEGSGDQSGANDHARTGRHDHRSVGIEIAGGD